MSDPAHTAAQYKKYPSEGDLHTWKYIFMWKWYSCAKFPKKSEMQSVEYVIKHSSSKFHSNELGPPESTSSHVHFV